MATCRRVRRRSRSPKPVTKLVDTDVGLHHRSHSMRTRDQIRKKRDIDNRLMNKTLMCEFGDMISQCRKVIKTTRKLLATFTFEHERSDRRALFKSAKIN